MRPLPTLRQLRYLVAVAEHRHFGRAAEDCLVTQSTLSAGIRELEQVLGVTLVDRNKRHVALTPLGEDIVKRAQSLLREADQLVDAAHTGSRPLTGLLRLGVIPTVGPYLLPQRAAGAAPFVSGSAPIPARGADRAGAGHARARAHRRRHHRPPLSHGRVGDDAPRRRPAAGRLPEEPSASQAATASAMPSWRASR